MNSGQKGLNPWIALQLFFIQIFWLLLLYFPYIVFMIHFEIQRSELSLSFQPLDCFAAILHSDLLSAFLVFPLISLMVRRYVQRSKLFVSLNPWIALQLFFIKIFSLLSSFFSFSFVYGVSRNTA